MLLLPSIVGTAVPWWRSRVAAVLSFNLLVSLVIVFLTATNHAAKMREERGSSAIVVLLLYTNIILLNLHHSLLIESGLTQ